VTHHPAPPPWLLATYRIALGGLLAAHGAGTLAGPVSWAEVAAGALVAVGLVTRASALLCAVAVAYAYLATRATGGEASALFCWGFAAIAVYGPGRWSLDGLRAGRPDDPPFGRDFWSLAA
jgi:putative oxidoreductase